MADPSCRQRAGILCGFRELRQRSRGGKEKTRSTGGRQGRLAHGKEQARATRRYTPRVLALALTGAPTLREAVAFEQRGSCKPLLRGDRGARGCARGALRGSVGAARAHPFLHPLPLVAEGSMITKAIQKDLVSRINDKDFRRFVNRLFSVLPGVCGRTTSKERATKRLRHRRPWKNSRTSLTRR